MGCQQLLGMRKPETLGFRPLLQNFLLFGIYFPVAWAAFLAFRRKATWFKACSRVTAHDIRPNERRASRAESCMLLLIESIKICSSIKYIVGIVVN